MAAVPGRLEPGDPGAPMSKDARSDARHALASARTANLGSWQAVDTRFGTFLVAAIEGRVVQSSLPGTPRERFLAELEARHPNVRFTQDTHDPVLAAACEQLAEYAEGRRRSFDIPVRLDGTAFQRR